MFIPSSSDDRTAFPSDLVHFSSQVAETKTSKRSRNSIAQNKAYALSNYAAPLMPLNDRDLKALTALFDREDSDEVEADIHKILLWLHPAPCWEDNPFDFLGEYL